MSDYAKQVAERYAAYRRKQKRIIRIIIVVALILEVIVTLITGAVLGKHYHI